MWLELTGPLAPAGPPSTAHKACSQQQHGPTAACLGYSARFPPISKHAVLCCAVLCPAGIAKFKDRTFVSTANGQAGTPAYMAPELFDGKPVTEKVRAELLLWFQGIRRYPRRAGIAGCQVGAVHDLFMPVGGSACSCSRTVQGGSTGPPLLAEA